MKLIYALLILIVFFAGIGFLIHICSKNKYVFKYVSLKRKIEIYPEKINLTNQMDKGESSYLLYYIYYHIKS